MRTRATPNFAGMNVIEQVLWRQRFRPHPNRKPIRLHIDRFHSRDLPQVSGQFVRCAKDLHVHELHQAQSLIDFLERAFSHQASCLEDADPCAELGQLVQDVAGDQDCFTHP